GPRRWPSLQNTPSRSRRMRVSRDSGNGGASLMLASLTVAPLARDGSGRQVARLRLAPGAPRSSPSLAVAPLARDGSGRQVARLRLAPGAPRSSPSLARSRARLPPPGGLRRRQRLEQAHELHVARARVGASELDELAGGPAAQQEGRKEIPPAPALREAPGQRAPHPPSPPPRHGAAPPPPPPP